MEPELIPQLIAQIALADGRVRREDKIERRAQAHMWAGILADVPYEYALQAAHAHYSKSTWPIMPADIASRWAADVRDRLTRHTGTFEPTAHPELDPDDEAGYRAALAAERHAVATGLQPPNELRAITAGPAAAEVQARLDQMGTYMPPAVKEELEKFRPDAVERERLIRSGLTDPRSVACPWNACHAPQGQRCRTNGKDRRDYHPARVEAAHAATRSAA
ncbi:hypothetical protein [Streptomyces sp. NPDC056069]|uniref:zinc finger domain-containing protein n=1 Tax=Streptomyces sp. NPDC056069 TaxID=3345702 RepID=UPI0035E06519